MGRTTKLSGVLPKVRSIVEFPQSLSKRAVQGYVAGIAIPAGVTAHQKQIPTPQLKKLLSRTAAEPKQSKQQQQQQLSSRALYSSQLSALRRSYYRQTVTDFFKQHAERQVKQKQAERSQRVRAKKEKEFFHQKDALFNEVFTLPTVDSFVKNPPPAPSKRNKQPTSSLVDNPILQEHLEKKVESIKELFKEADQFIYDIESLDRAIAEEFADNRLNIQVDYSERDIDSLVLKKFKEEYDERL
ncbi:hypothetical protein V1514DRAFT_338974 [Lipomyces japonicus]|uniref:uncharacterized protein n=1 Tax=Lipomyces japonicus TaxID=56871 RepID=UPI0034CE93F1